MKRALLFLFLGLGTAFGQKTVQVNPTTNALTQPNASAFYSANPPPSSGGATWGSITGTLASQTDLQTALNAKMTAALSGGTLTIALSGNTSVTFPTSGTLATTSQLSSSVTGIRLGAGAGSGDTALVIGTGLNLTTGTLTATGGGTGNYSGTFTGLHIGPVTGTATFATTAGSTASYTGTLAVANGGTGTTTLPSGQILIGNGTSAVTGAVIGSGLSLTTGTLTATGSSLISAVVSPLTVTTGTASLITVGTGTAVVLGNTDANLDVILAATGTTTSSVIASPNYSFQAPNLLAPVGPVGNHIHYGDSLYAGTGSAGGITIFPWTGASGNVPDDFAGSTFGQNLLCFNPSTSGQTTQQALNQYNDNSGSTTATTNGTTSITVTGSTTGMTGTMAIYMPNGDIPYGTTATLSGSTLTLSQAATGSHSGATLYFASGHTYGSTNTFVLSTHILSQAVTGISTWLDEEHGTNNYYLGGVTSSGTATNGSATISSMTIVSGASVGGAALTACTGYNVWGGTGTGNGADFTFLGTVSSSTSSSITLNTGANVLATMVTFKLCPLPTQSGSDSSGNWWTNYQALVALEVADGDLVTVHTFYPFVYASSGYNQGQYDENRLAYNALIKSKYYPNGSVAGVCFSDDANIPQLQYTGNAFYANYRSIGGTLPHPNNLGYNVVASYEAQQFALNYASSMLGIENFMMRGGLPAGILPITVPVSTQANVFTASNSFGSTNTTLTTKFFNELDIAGSATGANGAIIKMGGAFSAASIIRGYTDNSLATVAGFLSIGANGVITLQDSTDSQFLVINSSGASLSSGSGTLTIGALVTATGSYTSTQTYTGNVAITNGNNGITYKTNGASSTVGPVFKNSGGTGEGSFLFCDASAASSFYEPGAYQFFTPSGTDFWWDITQNSVTHGTHWTASTGNTEWYDAMAIDKTLAVTGTITNTTLAGGGMVKSSTGSLALATAGTDYSVITVQTGTLVGGSATKTVPSGCHPWVQDTASSLTNVGSLQVTVSGTTATVTSTNVLDTSSFTLFNAGSQ